MIRDKTVTIALQSANNEGCFWLAISAKLDRVSLGHEVSIAVSRLGRYRIMLTSIVALPSAKTSTTGADPPTTLSENDRLSGYGEPSFLGLEDRQMAC